MRKIAAKTLTIKYDRIHPPQLWMSEIPLTRESIEAMKKLRNNSSKVTEILEEYDRLLDAHYRVCMGV